MIDVVLISGQQGSGKTTTSRSLTKRAKEMGYDSVMTLKFAEPLYTLHEFILNRMERYNEIPRVEKDGKLLQLLGTDWGRTVFGDNVWVDVLKKEVGKKAELFQNTKALIIVDDCRFENEFNAFPDALRVRLVASEEARKLRCDSWRDNTKHASETGLDEYALSNKFDLYISTDVQESSREHCATLIAAQLQKKVWMEKR